MTSLHYTVRLALLGTFLFLLASCSELESEKVKHAFAVSIEEEHALENFDSVKFEPLEELNLGFFRGSIWIKLDVQNEKDQHQSYMFVSPDCINRTYSFYKLDPATQALVPVGPPASNPYRDQRTFNNPNPNFKIDLAPSEKASFFMYYFQVS